MLADQLFLVLDFGFRFICRFRIVSLCLRGYTGKKMHLQVDILLLRRFLSRVTQNGDNCKTFYMTEMSGSDIDSLSPTSLEKDKRQRVVKYA